MGQPPSHAPSPLPGATRSSKFPHLIAGAVLMLLAGIVALNVFADGERPAGVSDVEWKYCTASTIGVRGVAAAGIAGQEFLGWDRALDWESGELGATDLAAQQDAGAACRIGYELYGLEQAEWDWCFDETNRARLLAPAVAMLGMGEDEEIGTDSFREAPGDEPREYTQACRFAYHYARAANALPEIADPAAHPFFALSAEQRAWCEDEENSPDIEMTGRQLEIVTPKAAPPLHRITAHVRSCRIASIAAGVATEAIPTDD